jgi:peptidoglycan/xylan/chitin deacetylase (PgdA/CDA1 family)
MRHALPIFVLLLCLGVQSASLAGEAASFGSDALLHGLWTPQELRGSPAEAAAARTPQPEADSPPPHPLPVAPLAPELRGSIRAVSLAQGAKALALTFDLCETARETAGYAADVVEVLRSHAARATFFASGKWLVTHPERAGQLAADPRFELGGHGWAHRNTRLLDAAGRKQEIALTLAAYAQVREALAAKAAAKGLAREMEKLPTALRLWRFPYGACNAEALAELAAAGLPAIQWDVVSGDPAPGITAEAMAREVLRRVRPGSIVIFHANGRGHGTARALEIILPELARQGYALATASELLGMGRPHASNSCYGERPGDLDRFDRPGR